MSQGWLRIFQMNWFFGFPLGCVMYYGLSMAFPPVGLGIQEDMDTGIIMGLAVEENSATPQTGSTKDSPVLSTTKVDAEK